MRSSRFSTQVSYCGRTGVGVPGCGCGGPRHGSRRGVGVRAARGPGHPAQLAAASAQQRTWNQPGPGAHPKATLLSALGITCRPCGVPPPLPANPIYYRTRDRTIEARGPGCPGRSGCIVLSDPRARVELVIESQARGARAARKPGVPGRAQARGCPGRAQARGARAARRPGVPGPTRQPSPGR